MKSTYRLIAILLALCLLLCACGAPTQTGKNEDQRPAQSAAKETPRSTNEPQSFSADLTGEGGGQMFAPEILSFPDAGYGFWQGVRAGDSAVISACSQTAGEEGFILYRLDPETGAFTKIPNSGLDRPFSALAARDDGSAVAISQEQDEEHILLLAAADNSVRRITLHLEPGILARDLCLTETRCLVSADAQLLVLDEDGTILKTQELVNNRVMLIQSGEMPILAWDDPEGTKLQLLDDEGEPVNKLTLEGHYDKLFSGPEDTIFGLVGNTVYRIALPEGTREGFVGSFASGFNGFSFCWLADDCLLVPKSGQPALWHPADVEGLTILRLASYDTTSWSWLSEAVRDFNDQSADVKIDLINYADFDTGNATVNGLSRLNTDILSGYTPDIFVFITLPARSYENKGLIEDLWPWIDTDPEIDRENLLPEVIRLLERDGKLYDLVPTYRLWLVCGSKEQFGDKESLSMDDLFALAEQYDAQQLFGCMNRREFWENVLRFAGADFVNYDAPSCRFDSREFIRLLELSKGLSSKEEQDMSPEEWMEYLTLRNETTQRLVSGEQVFYFVNLNNMPVFMLQQADAIFRGEPRFVGFPSDSGSGIALEPFLRLGMSSASPNKEAVWKFFRFLLSDGYLTREKWNETPGESYCLMCIPTTRSAFDFRMSVWLENQFSVNASEYGNPDQEIVAGPETGARILALTAQSSSLYEYDQALLDMILDAAGAYYAGDRSAEDVAKLIQSKANLYLSEQYG